MKADWLFSPWPMAGMLVLTIVISMAVFIWTGWLFFFLFIPLPFFFWKRKN